MQAARAQFDVLERFAVGAKSAVIVDATRHVRPVSLYDSAVSGFLKSKTLSALAGSVMTLEVPGVFWANTFRSRYAATPPSAAT